MKSICLITEEWPGLKGCGGIGTAMYELALLLSKENFHIDVLIVPINGSETNKIKEIEKVNINILSIESFIHDIGNYSSRSHAVFQWLYERKDMYDAVHFHDYKGLGYFTQIAKKQGLIFNNTLIIVQIHGLTRWAKEQNKSLFTDENQLLIDYLEKQSCLMADHIVAPSKYIINWAINKGYIETNKNTDFIPNCHSYIINKINKKNNVKINEIIFIGRHENRKGIDLFIESILECQDIIKQNGIKISLFGSFGTVNDTPSELYITQKFGLANLEIDINDTLDRFEIINHLEENKNSLVVVPSCENSPYTVLEPLIIGNPVITSNDGSAK